jgi:hypothetical protein
MEEWRDIPEWEGLYQASDKGRIRSYPKQTVRGFRKGRVLTPVIKGQRYQAVTLSDKARRTQYLVHVLIAVTFAGARPQGHHTCHKDDNKYNNTASNIYYGTPGDNNRDKVKNGVQPFGSKHHNTKLTDAKVRRIRKEAEAGNTLTTIANKYEVSLSAVWSIVKRKTWRHI